MTLAEINMVLANTNELINQLAACREPQLENLESAELDRISVALQHLIGCT